MKRSIAILLLLAMILGIFAGCANQGSEPTVGPTEPTVDASAEAKENLAAAAEYLRTYYKDEKTVTPRKFDRLGAVRVGTQAYPITWSVNVPEDVIKIVVNDDGTVTIDIAEGITEETPYVLTATLTDEFGNVETVEFNYTIPASLGTMQEIVDMAYALESGSALEVPVTLTGVITVINTPYDAGYKNITVTMTVAEREDYPIKCFRLKGEGADSLMPGDTITVTGTLENYQGVIEFAAGCALEEVVKGDFVFNLPEDPKEIVDMAYALGQGESFPVQATLTGKVTSIDTPYDAGYKNLSVWMTVEGRETKPILCYRLKGDGVDQIAIGDTITVTGTLTNYNGKIEFTQGCTMSNRVSGGGTVAKDPGVDTQVVDEAYALAPGAALSYIATLRGTVIKVNNAYDAGYGNVTVTIVIAGRENMPIKCFRMKGDAAPIVGVNDVIDVTGIIKNYVHSSGNTEVEFDAGCTGVMIVNNADPVEPEVPVVPAGSVVDSPVAGTAYKFGMVQGNLNKTYYLAGGMDGFYMATTLNSAEAIDVYLEETEGGVYFYTLSGDTKTYINMVVSSDGAHVNGAYEAAASTVYTFDATSKTIIANVNGEPYWFGTRNDKEYTTMGPCKTSFEGFYGQFYTSSGSTEPDEPDVPVKPEVTLAETVTADTAYKFGMVQGNLNKTYYLAGGMDGFYMATTEDINAAIDVYLEETEGGNHFYTNVDGVKTYINMVVSSDGAHVNGAYDTTASTVYTFDTTSKTIIANVNGEPYWFGTRNDKNYTTMGPCKTSFKGFYGQFYTVTGGTETPDPDAEKAAAVDALIEKIGEVTKESEAAIKAAREAYDALTDAQKALVTKLDVLTAAEAALEELNKPETPAEPTYVTSIVPGTAYKLGLNQTDKGAVYYFVGTMSGYYGATETDYVKGVDVFVEETTGGYYLYFLNDSGVKQYINLVASGTYRNFKYGTSASTVFTWDAEKNALYTTVSGEVCYMGTYGSYVTVGVLQSSKLKDTDYIARLYTLGGSTEPDVPEVNEDEEAAKAVDALIDVIGTVTKESEAAIKAAREAYDALTDAQKALVTKLDVLTAAEAALEELNKPETPAEPTYVTSIVPGTAYKLGLNQTDKGAVYYFVGTMSGYYGATETDYVKGVDVFVEETTGGYYLYFLNDSGVKQYINLVASGTYRNFKYGTSASTVFTWDAEKNALYTTVSGEVCYMGTYGSYVTVGVLQSSKLKDTDYIARLYTLGGSTEPDVPVEPEEPAADSELSIVDAVALGQTKEHDTYTKNKYYVTGVISEVKDTTWGNMYIKDENGNSIYVYGLYDATGKTGYADMETKPVAGDTVKLYGVIGKYNGNSQIKDAWLIEHTPAEGGDDEETPVEPAVLATFTFKSGTTSEWADGNDMTDATATYTDGDYTLTFTDRSKVYAGGWDPKNNGFIKFGTSSVAGTLTFTVPEDVTSVVLHLSGYKAKTSKYKINDGDTVTLTKSANNAEYDVVTVDTTENKTVTVATASGGTRMVMYSVIYMGVPAHEHSYKSVSTATCVADGITTYTCECGDTYTEETAKLGHIDENLDIDCDRDGCTSKVAPPANSLLSNFTANNLGSKLSSSYQYYVQGTIVEVLDAKNGVFLIDDGTDEKFYFRLPKNADGVSHASWAIKLTLGDKVKVYGKINKYSTNTAPNGQYWPAIQSGVVTLLEQHPHDFTFSAADCKNPAACACGQTNGAPRGCVDADGNSICDDCGKNTKYAYEYVEIRTDNNSGVHDATAYTYTWTNGNFGVQVAKASGGNLYVTSKDHMRLYKGNQLVLVNKNGLTVKTITVYLTNATQIGNFEKLLTGYTYTKNEVDFTITVEVDSFETLTLTNPSSNGSTTQVKGVEFGYAK